MLTARHKDFVLCLRLLRQARPYWLHLAGILLLGLLATPLTLLMPLPLKIAVDSVINSHPPPRLLTMWLPAAAAGSAPLVLALAAALLVVTTLLLYVQALGNWWLQTYTGERLVLAFRAELFRHVQRLSLGYHDTKGPADSIYRIQYDAPCIQYVTISAGMPLLTAVVTLAGMIAVTAMIDSRVALVPLVVCPVLYWLTRGFGRRLRARWYEVKEFETSAMSVVQEVLGAVRVVKAFGREQHEQERFVDRLQKRLRGQLDLAYIEGRFDLSIGLTLALGTAAALFIGVLHVRSRAITLGELLVVMSYLAQIYEPLKTISKKVADLQSALASADRAFSLLDEVPEVIERPHAVPLVKARGDLVFRDVSFGYPNCPPVLHDLSFVVEPGMRVGIAGRTGAGKTTLLMLLMRFYDPDAGQIRLDGIDFRDYRVADLRNQFAVVPQEPVLFSTSIAENIAYANPRATEADIIRAAEMANAHDFIMALPDGYGTEVGDRGMRLSGGERQRVSLARAFLKDAPILILDEPTSSVDVATEAAILEAMERLMPGRTTFIIGHRLNTLQNCDLQLELAHGRIVAKERRKTPLPDGRGSVTC